MSEDPPLDPRLLMTKQEWEACKTWLEVEIPSKCPECGEILFVRAELDQHEDNTVSELWECDKHHLFRVIYKPVRFIELKETPKEAQNEA